MIFAYILLAVSTISGLFALWKEDFTKAPTVIPDEETAAERAARQKEKLKEAKTRKLKQMGSLFILLTLSFTVFKLRDDQANSDKAKGEKETQRKLDSARYEQELSTRERIAAIQKKQIEAYEATIAAGKTIDDIQNKSNTIKRTIAGVDTATKRSIRKIDESARNANDQFNNLVLAASRTQNMIDNNIYSDFSFGFRSPKTDQAINRYMEENHIDENFINIDERFPYYNELQSLLTDVSLELELYSYQISGTILNDETGKRMINIFNPPGVLYLSNKQPLIFAPYRRPSGPNPKMLYYDSGTPNMFKMVYITRSKTFFFTCDKVELNIDKRLDEYYSILDLEGTALLLIIKVPEVRDNPNSFFTLEKSYVNYTINFSNKKNTSYQGNIQPLITSGRYIWPKFLTDHLTFGKSLLK